MNSQLPDHVYRIARTRYTLSAAIALSGDGGLQVEGRWHSRGRSILYTSQDSSTCLLERLVHTDAWIAEAQRDRELLRIVVADVRSVTFSFEDMAGFDADWQQEGNITCRNLGDHWLEQGDFCAMVVPSAANPHANNILFNPQHAQFSAILAANAVLDRTPLDLDERVVSLARHRRAG